MERLKKNSQRLARNAKLHTKKNVKSKWCMTWMSKERWASDGAETCLIDEKTFFLLGSSCRFVAKLTKF